MTSYGLPIQDPIVPGPEFPGLRVIPEKEPFSSDLLTDLGFHLAFFLRW